MPDDTIIIINGNKTLINAYSTLNKIKIQFASSLEKKQAISVLLLKYCGTGFIVAYEIHKASSNAITNKQIN
jgi:hypothetical protein